MWGRMTKANQVGVSGGIFNFSVQFFFPALAHSPTHHRVKYQRKQLLAHFLLRLRLLFLNFDFSILNSQSQGSILHRQSFLSADFLLITYSYPPSFPLLFSSTIRSSVLFNFYFLYLIHRVFPFLFFSLTIAWWLFRIEFVEIPREIYLLRLLISVLQVSNQSHLILIVLLIVNSSSWWIGLCFGKLGIITLFRRGRVITTHARSWICDTWMISSLSCVCACVAWV